MIFEKVVSSNSEIVMPMSCSCGTDYDVAKSQGKWTGDQKRNSGSCNSSKT